MRGNEPQMLVPVCPQGHVLYSTHVQRLLPASSVGLALSSCRCYYFREFEGGVGEKVGWHERTEEEKGRAGNRTLDLLITTSAHFHYTGEASSLYFPFYVFPNTTMGEIGILRALLPHT